MLLQPVNIPIQEDMYELTETYTYYWTRNGTQYRIIVPEGFRNDGASIPRIFWTILGLTPDGLIRAAALIHDFILVNKGRLKENHQLLLWAGWKECGKLIDKKSADKLFKQIAIESGIPKWKANIAYLAIRFYTRLSNKYEWK